MKNVPPRVHRREIRIQRQRMDCNVRIPSSAINRPLHISRNRLVLRYPSFRDAEEGRGGALYRTKPNHKPSTISLATKATHIQGGCTHVLFPRRRHPH